MRASKGNVVGKKMTGSNIPIIHPWEKIKWSDEQFQAINRDWGQFFTRQQKQDIAAQYYDKALEILPDDPKALLYRSKCRRRIAQTEGALVDSKAAEEATIRKGNGRNYQINLEICDGLYELNRFEDCLADLHNNTRKYHGKKVAPFEKRVKILGENFKDSTGDSLGRFILKHKKLVPSVLAEVERKNFVDERPLWKILKEQERCDVLSVLEKEEVLLSPREIARRNRREKVFTQTYLGRNWVDVFFLKSLREDKNLLPPESKASTPILRNLTRTKYDDVTKFMNILHARSPMYNEQMRKCPIEKVCEKNHEDYLYRVQYQTRRNTQTILKSCKHLRKQGDIGELSKYVEEVMGDYIVLTTNRVLPGKFEFINEVYNTLALAHAERYTVPDDIMKIRAKDRLLVLLHMPLDKKDKVEFVFGDKSTWQESDAIDYGVIAYKNFLSRLENRMRFSKFSIERCYLLHETARSHLAQRRLEECCTVARKACDECKKCGSNLWEFLSTLLICKAHALIHKVERGKEALNEAKVIAKKLNAPNLIEFIKLCLCINEEEISLKKRTQSVDSMRKQRSKLSINSRNSQFSNASYDTTSLRTNSSAGRTDINGAQPDDIPVAVTEVKTQRAAEAAGGGGLGAAARANRLGALADAPVNDRKLNRPAAIVTNLQAPEVAPRGSRKAPEVARRGTRKVPEVAPRGSRKAPEVAPRGNRKAPEVAPRGNRKAPLPTKQFR